MYRTVIRSSTHSENREMGFYGIQGRENTSFKKYRWRPGVCDHILFFKKLLFLKVVVKYKEHKMYHPFLGIQFNSVKDIHLLWKIIFMLIKLWSEY